MGHFGILGGGRSLKRCLPWGGAEGSRQKNVTKQIPQQPDTQQTPQTCHNKGYISKTQKQSPRTKINLCVPARWIHRTAFWLMAFDFLEKVLVSLPFAPVLALVKATSNRFILMPSIFFSRITLSLYLFLTQIREEPARRLTQKYRRLCYVENLQDWKHWPTAIMPTNWGARQIFLTSRLTTRRGKY